MGEFVFDWEWAEAAHRVGIQYYPKMLVGVPFTPVTGARFLTAQDQDRKGLIRLMGQALAKVAADNKISSVHVNFCLGEEREALEEIGFFARAGLQFHWQNQHFRSDDYLGSFRSDSSNKIKRERRRSFQGELLSAPSGTISRERNARVVSLYKGRIVAPLRPPVPHGGVFDEVQRRFAPPFA
jgi:predicted N-acyltransferase